MPVVVADSINMFDLKNDLDGYCISYYLRNLYEMCDNICRQINVVELMSYCVRSFQDNYSLTIPDYRYTSNLNITFAHLRQKNITSQMLLSWSTSIDVAEQYQIFLNNNSISSFENELVFHNCTSPWFGPSCRFTIDYPMMNVFKDIVDLVFLSKSSIYGDRQVTCYIHITCQQSLSCLDWREICDGKQDCEYGTDEKDCWQLEINECNEDEYRCRNGQCIPWEYHRDGSEQTECLDRTDELSFHNSICYQNPQFKCEEHMCQPGNEEFPCGDGQCIDEMSTCSNGRASFLPNNFCTNLTLCFLQLSDYQVDYEWCVRHCGESDCIMDHCFIAYEFQHLPFFFGHVRYVVSNESINPHQIALPDYICYNASLCSHLPPPTALFNNLTCRHFDDLELQHASSYSELLKVAKVIKDLFRRCLFVDKETTHCSSSTMYQCFNSTKCISKYRLLDGIGDCPFDDDETYNQSCSLPDIHQRFKCRDEVHEKCYALLALQNEKKECKYGEDEYEYKDILIRTHISFSTICDGVIHLLPLFIDGQLETDETGCELWECNNTYSRCDGIWLCKNGADEVDCPSSACSIHHHNCVFPNDTLNVSCLPIDRAGDDIDDCIGGTDERTKNRIPPTNVYDDIIQYSFRCQNNTKLIWATNMCNNQTDCPLNDDEIFCRNFAIFPDAMCWMSENSRTNVEIFLCNLRYPVVRRLIIPFTLYNVLSYPLELQAENITIIPSNKTESHSMTSNLHQEELSAYSGWICNRGVPFHFRMHDNRTILLCFCPPSYYGERCQYQNQRVSLTIQIRLTSDWRMIFVFFITLIDKETNIESHEHIEYIHRRDCPVKYNLYLLYATRPKNISKTFSVRIDAFTGMTLKYRSSWIFPVQFVFLPVYRLPVILRIPFLTTILPQEKCSPSCIHGQCSYYVNRQNSTFCLCNSGWSGVRCDIKLNCDCASNAICITEAICLCPPGQFGQRCHLSQPPLYSKPCANGGQRLPIDARYVSAHGIFSACICAEGYTGVLCEKQQKQIQIDISFHHQLTIPSSLLVHFITVPYYDKVLPNRRSIAKKLQFDQSSLTMYTTTSFNIALAQMLGHYYLIILHEDEITKTHIITEVLPAYRCRSLVELFNHTFINQHVLKRIKSYHLPCQRHGELVCFYDDVHICLCTLDRSANCLEFDHNMTYECEKLNYCGDEGECFQDDLTCPTSSFCVCHGCYFGSRCQFSTKGSTLSLDIILGYHIRSTNNFSQQATIVKTAIMLISIILVVGIINGFLSFLTFQGKETRNVGCGLYLLTTSIVSIITVIMLTGKFILLMLSQIGSLNNHWFLHIQCASMDFVVRLLLSINDWLNACIAVERVVSVTQGVTFSKTKSKKLARWMIIILILCVSCSYLYDPVHRRVINDEEEQRTWCITQYTEAVQIFDWIVNIIHLSFPFVINGISAVIVIIAIARTRSNSQKTRPFKKHLREQLHYHKHLLISPLILVALGLPRLVISFLSGCMGSARESWLYLMGYYVSFLPTITTLFVFILPSELYKKQLYQMIRRVWHR